MNVEYLIIMRKIICIVAGALMISSCGTKHEGEKKTGLLSNFLSITDNENKGVKEVLRYYGGVCEYSKGVSKTTDDTDGKFFGLELRESKVLEQQASISEMPASNIAYRFYKNLVDEKNKYDYIKVLIKFKDGTKQVFKYSCSDLEQLKSKVTIANSIVALIKQKNFDSVVSVLDNKTVYTYDKNELSANLPKLESELGDITEGFRMLGFTVKQQGGEKPILHISGVIVRNKQNTNFSVDIDWEPGHNNVYLIQYKL